MIHRDIKPGNLWLEVRHTPVSPRGGGAQGEGFRVKILDFGLARAMSDQTHLTQSGAIIGTPAYMAPEQAGGRDIDHRCDLFSLGCVLYHLCTGEMAFKGRDTLAIITALALETPQAPHEVDPAIPVELSDLVMHLLAKKPEDRPQSAQEVAAELAALSEANTATVPQPRKSKWPAAEQPNCGASDKRRLPAPRSSPRNKWLLVASVGVLLLAGVVGMWAGGVFRVKTPEGILVVNVNEPNPDVYLDGDKMTVAWGKDGKHAEIRVKPGTRKVEVKKDGFTAFGEEVALQDGKRRILTAKLVSQVPPVPPNKDNPPPPAKDTVELDLGRGVKLKMVRIPAKGKTFWMGSPKDEQYHGDDEEQHEVEFSHDFYLGVTEVTQAQYRAVMNSNPSWFCKDGGGKEKVADLNTDDFPVENMTWKQAKEFCEKHTEK